MTDPLLTVRGLNVEFRASGGRRVKAVTDISFDIQRGETLGLVGESGCGKSSVARGLMQLPPPQSGEMWFEGEDLGKLGSKELRALRPRIQMIFQDPIASLNPRRRVADIVAAPLRATGRAKKSATRQVVSTMLEAVGIDPVNALDRLPHEFSGGQCQRISIARALILKPALLICDEPVSALDVSVQAQILNLLRELKQQMALTMLFISHDLAVIKNVCDKVAVMYLGRLCEVASCEQLYRSPRHPYTKALLSAIPVPDPNRQPEKPELIAGDLPSPTNPPSGCRFRTRCPRAKSQCASEVPPLSEIAPGHKIACHFPIKI